MSKERYESLNGIRAYTCVGVVLKHVLANGNFSLRGFVFERLIPSFQFSMFFMLISAFAMCCGYYEQFKNGTVSLEQFYKRRYRRIWPFFALLCTVELIVTHNLNALYEWFADLTLAFGLIPNHEIRRRGRLVFGNCLRVLYDFPFFRFPDEGQETRMVCNGHLYHIAHSVRREI